MGIVLEDGALRMPRDGTLRMSRTVRLLFKRIILESPEQDGDWQEY